MTDGSPIPLGSAMRVADVTELKAACDLMTGDLNLDASEIENVDAAVLQYLVALRRHCEAETRNFAVLNPSAAFIKAAALVGFQAELGLSAPA